MLFAPNDDAGWPKLVVRLRGFSISLVGIEASGGYERERCSQTGMSVANTGELVASSS